jgi:N-carbamoylputrescine amidase
MPTTKFTVALLQMRIAADAEANLANAERMLAEAAARKADVAVLPELFAGYYFCQTEDHTFFDTAEPIPGRITQRLQAAARKLNLAVVGSLFEHRMPGVYHNTATVHDAGGEYLGLYRKMHIPDDPLFLEKFYFTPGDTGWKVFATKNAKVGTLVCWDQWYPEAARLTALKGAEILVYPTAIGWHPAEKAEFGEGQHSAWETSMRGHAVANGIYVAAVNRVGFEHLTGEGLEFWGQSFVADPFGKIIARGSVDREEVIVVECDRQHMESVRRHWPFYRDRRIDAYGDIVRRVVD